MGRLNSSLDQFLVLILLSAIQLAEYRVGAWQIPLITTVAYSTGAVYLPHFKQLFETGRAREAIGIWRTSVQKVSLITVPVATVFIVGAEEFIILAFTEEYVAAAAVFRLYCLMLLLRVAHYGAVIVAAGRPGLVLRAAAWTLATNAVLSVPLVLWLGFVGPALGTALAFIPTVIIYCKYIAKASGVGLTEVFPLLAWCKVLLTALLPASLALVVKFGLDAPVAVRLALEAFTIVVFFSLLATWTRQITRQDWRFVADWMRMKTT